MPGIFSFKTFNQYFKVFLLLSTGLLTIFEGQFMIVQTLKLHM